METLFLRGKGRGRCEAIAPPQDHSASMLETRVSSLTHVSMG